jgi:hypothetical protein
MTQPLSNIDDNLLVWARAVYRLTSLQRYCERVLALVQAPPSLPPSNCMRVDAMSLHRRLACMRSFRAALITALHCGDTARYVGCYLCIWLRTFARLLHSSPLLPLPLPGARSPLPITRNDCNLVHLHLHCVHVRNSAALCCSADVMKEILEQASLLPRPFIYANHVQWECMTWKWLHCA